MHLFFLIIGVFCFIVSVHMLITLLTCHFICNQHQQIFRAFQTLPKKIWSKIAFFFSFFFCLLQTCQATLELPCVPSDNFTRPAVHQRQQSVQNLCKHFQDVIYRTLHMRMNTPTCHTQRHTHKHTPKHTHQPASVTGRCCLCALYSEDVIKHTTTHRHHHTQTHTHKRTHTNTHTHKHTHTNTHTYTQKTHTYTHKHTHTNTQTHTQTHTILHRNSLCCFVCPTKYDTYCLLFVCRTLQTHFMHFTHPQQESVCQKQPALRCTVKKTDVCFQAESSPERKKQFSLSVQRNKHTDFLFESPE